MSDVMSAQTMGAVEITAPGGPDVLRWTQRALPAPKGGEIQIRVEAAGVNGHDLGQRRRGSHPIEPGETNLPGLEVAGTVSALGADVTRWKLGDAVCALIRGGGYAEYVCVDERLGLAPPAGCNFVAAASLPETCFTVWSNVFVDGGLKPGDTLLMNGGAGGIGVTAIQIAAALGATVYATTRGPEKVARCLELGAHRVIDTLTEDYVEVLARETHGKGIDVILDVVAGDTLNKNLKVLGVGGRLVIIGAAKGYKTDIDMSDMGRKRAHIMSSILRPRTLAYKAELADSLRSTVWPLYASGRIRPVIDSTFPLAQAARAHERLESGQHFGKVVLTVGAAAQSGNAKL